MQSEDTVQATVAVARVLLIVQGAIALVATVEALIFGTAFGAPLSAAVVVTAGGAIMTLWLAAAVVRRSRRARKLALILQLGWLSFAAVDMLLAGFLTQRGLELVPVLTRIVLPLAIVVILRRREVRAWFGITNRRERRRRAVEAMP